MTKNRDDGGAAGEGNPLDLLRKDLSYLLAFNDALLELVPDPIAVLDEKFRVRACNSSFREIAGAGSGPFSLAGDAPLLRAEVAPGRTLAESLRSLLREGGARSFRRVRGGDDEERGLGTFAGKAAVWDSGDPESRRVLLWIRRPSALEETRGSHRTTDRIPPRPAGGGFDVSHETTPSGIAAHPVPLKPEAMVSPERLRRWPAPKGRRVLVANRSPWDAVLLSRAVREAGVEEITIVESPKEAWEKNDPAGYGLAVVVIPEEGGEEMADFCRRLTSYAPTVPVIVLADRAPKARDTLGELPLLGILGKARREENLRIVTQAVFGERAGRAPAEESAAPEEETTTGRAPYGVVLLGAGEEGLPVIRRVDGSETARLLLVFDPDERAPGLARARDLYVPSASTKEDAGIDGSVHAVILSEEGLDRWISELGLEDALLLAPADVEGFLADPEEFLGVPDPPEEAPEEGVGEGGGEPARDFDGKITEGRPEEMEEPERTEVVAKEADSGAETAGGGDEVERTLSTIAAAPGAERRKSRPATPPAPAGGVGELLDALDLLLDFKRFAARVLDMALHMTGGKTGSLMIIDDETRELRILASKGIPEAVARKTRQRLGEGIAGRVAESGEPLLLQGRIGDRRFRGMGGRPDIQSSVCVPLRSGRKVIGTLSVNCPPESPVLEEAELDRVAEFGSQIGGALDQSRQMERSRLRSFELSVRAEIEAIAFSREDLNRKLSLIADKIVEMLEVDVCAIYLADAERKALVLQAVSGIGAESHASYSVPVGKGIVGYVAAERRPLVLRSDSSDQDPVRTSMAVPVLHQTELMGVVGIEDISRGDFDENRFGLVSSIASSVGLLIGDACAHADSKKKVTMLSAISEMGVAFTAARDRVGLAKLVAFCAATVLESDVATVRLLRQGAEPGTGETAPLDLLATQGTSMPGPDDPLAALDEKMVSVTAVRGKPCRDQDVRADEIRPFLDKANTSAVLSLPLLSGDAMIGSVVVYRVERESRRESGYREHEVEVGLRLADYAAAAARSFLPKEDEY